MGHVRVPIRISHPEDASRSIVVPDALVDTAATWTTVPPSIATSLGLRRVGTLPSRTAAGPRDFEQSYAYLEVQDKYLVSHILVGDDLEDTLIGVTTLEALGFVVDPLLNRLINVELLLL